MAFFERRTEPLTAHVDRSHEFNVIPKQAQGHVTKRLHSVCHPGTVQRYSTVKCCSLIERSHRDYGARWPYKGSLQEIAKEMASNVTRRFAIIRKQSKFPKTRKIQTHIQIIRIRARREFPCRARSRTESAPGTPRQLPGIGPPSCLKSKPKHRKATNALIGEIAKLHVKRFLKKKKKREKNKTEPTNPNAHHFAQTQENI